jgi:hypothetical protein
MHAYWLWSRGCVTIKKNTQFVILNEVKNLMIFSNCSAEILRLKPQNDIKTQPPLLRMTTVGTMFVNEAYKKFRKVLLKSA